MSPGLYICIFPILLSSESSERLFPPKNLVQEIRARGYKTFFVLNSVEHEISNAHKYKNIKKFSFGQAQISGEGYFSCS